MLSVYGKVRFVVNKDMINTRGEGVNPLSLLTAFAASSPKGTPLSYAGNFTSAAKSRPLGEGGKAAGFDGRGIPPRGCFRRKPARQFAAYRCDPSREKAVLENPQIFQNCEKNNSSSEYAQSTAERIPNRSLIKKGCRTNLCSSLSCYSSGAALDSST